MAADPSPAIPTQFASEMREVRGRFDRQADLDEAIDRLRQVGFDRAELSLPQAAPARGEATPEQGAANPDTPIDRQQARTIAGSTTGVAAAMIGAGVTVATGGAALVAAGVAVAAGLAAGGAAHVVTAAGMGAARDQRDHAAASGTLVLSIVAKDDQQADVASDTLRACGAVSVEKLARPA